MLYYLLYEQLYRYASPLRVFRYTTFRTAFASLTALFLCIALGPWLIDKLREFQIGQYIREEGPQSHQKKAGTPTMGGVLIIISIVVPTLLWADLRYPYVWIAIAALIGYGWIGFMDDYAKVSRKRNLGRSGRAKLVYQFVLGFAFALVLLVMRAYGDFNTAMNIPFLKDFQPSLLIQPLLHNPWTYALGAAPFCIFVALVVVFSSNAVNLTDGLDGLAIGCTAIVSFVFLVLTYVVGNSRTAAYLNIPHVSGAGELTVFCAAMIGACLGFLWFNCHPAQVFMGDTGSLALGGVLAMVAVLIHQPLALALAGGVFVAEAGSVLLQRGWFKFTRLKYGEGRRVFLRAPLHHHFEKLGWYESQVVTRFYILCVLFAVLALSTLKIR